MIIPVPLHTARMKQRGFNQALLLTTHWQQFAAASNLPFKNFRIAPGLLRRIRPTLPQSGLDQQHRLSNIRNAFSVNTPSRIVKHRILLIDDVYTTGATVAECAGLLMKHGAQSVDVLTLARTQ